MIKLSSDLFQIFNKIQLAESKLNKQNKLIEPILPIMWPEIKIYDIDFYKKLSSLSINTYFG